MSFDFKERDISFSEFPIGKFNSVRYPSRDSIFRNILIAFNRKKKSSSILAIRASHFEIEFQSPNWAKKSVSMFPFTYSSKTRNNNRIWFNRRKLVFLLKNQIKESRKLNHQID